MNRPVSSRLLQGLIRPPLPPLNKGESYRKTEKPPRANPQRHLPYPSRVAFSLTARRRPIVGVGGCAGAEDGLADADDGCAFLDRDLIVARHAHGEFIQRYAVRRAVAEPVAEVAKPLEAGADAGCIAGEKRERHQPANAK